MRRGACFGRCAEYVITLHTDGTVEYNGVRNVDMIGVYRKAVGADQVAPLFKKIADDRIDTCKATYKTIIPDLPGLYYEVMINGEKKPIGNAHFGPPFLVEISQDIDQIGGKPDASWKMISDKPGN